MGHVGEVCANCGQGIGQLETPHVWADRVVCGACYGKLTTASAPLAYATPAPPPITSHVIMQQPQRGANGLGIASLVIGIVGILTAWIPFVGLFGAVIAGIGLLLGLLGLLIAVVGRRSTVGMAVAGCTVCFSAICIAIFMTGLVAHGISNAAANAQARANAMNAAGGFPPPSPSFSNATPTPASTSAAPETPIPVEATDLVAAYAANELAADQKYRGKLLKVSGIVSGIRRDLLDKPFVTMKSNDPIRQVQVSFSQGAESRLADFHVGEGMEVTGRCKGLMMNVLIEAGR